MAAGGALSLIADSPKVPVLGSHLGLVLLVGIRD